MFVVYALGSENRRYIYVGLTENLERRLNEHNSGKNRTTKPYRPFRVLFTKSFDTRTEARREEIRLKGGSGKEFLYTLYSGK